MHYIRFCRPPEVHAGRTHASVKIVLTITTDLSDSFLSPRHPVQLAVIGAYTERKDGRDRLVPVSLTQQSSPPTWRAGMRVLKLELPLPAQAIETLQIRPLSRQLTALGTDDVLPGNQGLIMAVYADMPRPGDGTPPSMCFRSLRLSAGGVTAGQTLQIEEDLGESIARHIWDSGIVMVSLLADLCLDTASGPNTAKPLPLFRSTLQRQDRPLNILELGCGVGVLGIGLARIAALTRQGVHSPPRPHILMTDLPEAEAKARANIARQASSLLSSTSSSEGAQQQQEAEEASLDFEPLDWQDGRHGQFGAQAAARAWDLVVLCDCTYNTDTLPPLVETLSALHAHTSKQGAGVETEVLVATKQRHSDERVFFDLMAAAGWAVREQTMLPLPMLDGEAQRVEVYLFGKQG